MAQQSFIFGGNTGRSYEDLKRMRREAEAIRPKMGQVKTGIAGYGSGISALGRALVHRIKSKEADALEKQQREQFTNEFNNFWGGQGKTTQNMGFRNPGKQHMNEDSFARNMGTNAMAQVEGNDMTGANNHQAMLAQDFSNLPKNQNPAQMQPIDSNNWGQPAAVPQNSMMQPSAENSMMRPVDPRLFSLLNNPYATNGQKALMQLMVQRQIQKGDPLYQAQIQKANLDNKVLQNKLTQAQKGKPDFRILSTNEANQLGLPSDKIYQQGDDGRVYPIGGDGQNININTGEILPDVNKLPANFIYVRDKDGNIVRDENGLPKVIPIPGSPADADAINQNEKEEMQKELVERSGSIVIEDINRSLDLIQNNDLFDGTGFLGNLTKGLPGTDANELLHLLETIKTNVGFDKLQQMRDASPTGGALGQVSEKEMNQLQAVLGNLNQGQKAKNLIFNLDRLKRIYNEIVHGEESAIQMEKNSNSQSNAAGGSVTTQPDTTNPDDPLGLF